MTDPIDKLDQTCEVLGDECKELVKKRKTEEINEIDFVNKYFTLLRDYPNNDKKNKMIKDLKGFLKDQKNIIEQSEED